MRKNCRFLNVLNALCWKTLMYLCLTLSSSFLLVRRVYALSLPEIPNIANLLVSGRTINSHARTDPGKSRTNNIMHFAHKVLCYY